MDLSHRYRPRTREDLAAGKRGAGKVEPGQGVESVEEDGITKEISKDGSEDAEHTLDADDNDYSDNVDNRLGNAGPNQMLGDDESGGGPAVVEDLLDDDTDTGDEPRYHPEETPAETGERLARYWLRMKREGYEHLFDVFENAAIKSSKLGHDFDALLEQTKAGLSSGTSEAPQTKSHAEATLKELERRRKETVLALSESEGRYSLMRDHEKQIESNITLLQSEQAEASQQLEQTRAACKDLAERLKNLKHASADIGTPIVDNFLGILPSLPPAALAQILHEASAQLARLAMEAQQQQGYSQASIYEQGPSILPDPEAKVAALRGLEGGTKGEKK
ncbi:hypothetical protein PRZ48_014780 [Zasmidium cellare]|uniref:Uncharacterized protein n=1 Tax=Zasmidium cellare TaxID=395010 RepID=A0ABR0DZ92_ZASCE|nr:hypothetical protein PRZ48_014780 [Zasmidium cellare]